MAYTPVSRTVPQYSVDGSTIAAGYYLKGYTTGTTTALSMATDSTGGTLIAKCKLNTAGYPLSTEADDTSVFIPHFNAPFKLALYTNATDADADTTANAVWVVDAIPNEDVSLVTAVKTADKSLTSNDTLEDDNHLAGMVLLASQTYAFEAFLKASSATVTPDIQFAFQVSTALTDAGYSFITVEAGTPAFAGDTRTNLTGTETIQLPTASVETHILMKGFVVVSATDTTVDLQWAQGTSDATATVLHRGSWVKFTKL